MRIVKTIIFLASFVLCLCFSVNASADQLDLGLDGSNYSLPSDITEELYGNNITPENVDISALDIGNIVNYLWDELSIYIQSPLRLFISIIAVVLVCSFAGTVSDTANVTVKKVFNLICILSGTAIITVNVSEVIAYGEKTLEQGKVFISSFIPAFAGVISMSGRVTSATALNSFIMGGIQLFMQLASGVILPFSICIMGITLAGTVNTDLKLSGFGESIKKIVIWTLGIIMTVFVALLGLQTFITSGADSVGLKATKFTVSNAVPFIGGAISDSLSVMLGGVDVIKNNFGVFGVIAGAVIMLPSVLSALCYKMVLSFA
ncbi:MAG: stage III sporulation protein AE, partial [Ruminiclostridium sp.]|nr:stage III sporulation protein AE [Ruminiclostridium sp.]